MNKYSQIAKKMMKSHAIPETLKYEIKEIIDDVQKRILYFKLDAQTKD